VCLPLLISPYTIKSRSSLLAPAHPGCPGKRAVKRLCVCVRVCVIRYFLMAVGHLPKMVANSDSFSHHSVGRHCWLQQHMIWHCPPTLSAIRTATDNVSYQCRLLMLARVLWVLLSLSTVFHFLGHCLQNGLLSAIGPLCCVSICLFVCPVCL